MTHLTQQVFEGAGQALASLSQGWRELKDRASGALTRFQPGREPSEDADAGLPSVGSWAFMAADVVEGKDRLVVRLEAPGMSRSDLKIELRDGALWIEGEKRMEREFAGDGHHTIECAYGSFRRAVPLPTAVNADKAKASYRDGVLRVELPKAEGATTRRFAIPVK